LDPALLNKIAHAKCETILPSIPDNTFDMIYWDPPYYLRLGRERLLTLESGREVNGCFEEWDQFESLEDYDQKMGTVIAELQRVLKPSGSLWASGTYHCVHRIGRLAEDLGMWHFSECIWQKCLSRTTRLYVRWGEEGEREGVATLEDVAEAKSQVYLWDGVKWNRVKQIARTAQPEAPLGLRLRNGEIVRCTANHRWPTNRGLLRADEVRPGDIIETCRLPEPPSKAKNKHIPDAIGWLVGLFLAEGSWDRVDKDGGYAFKLSIHTDELGAFLPRVREAADWYDSTVSTYTSGNRTYIRVCGRVLCQIVSTYISGDSSRTKHLRPVVWDRSNLFLEELFQGYLDGDGSSYGVGQWRLGFSRNDTLASQLRTLGARLGYQVYVKPTRASKKDNVDAGFSGWVSNGASRQRANSGEVVAIVGSKADAVFYDICLEEEPHLFALASGILSHNSNPMPNFLKARPTNSFETLLWFCKNEKSSKQVSRKFNFELMREYGINDHGSAGGMGIWKVALCQGGERLKSDGESLHSTQKPLELLRRMLSVCTAQGDLVLDPMGGTCTTAVACKQMRRNFVVIEQIAKYAEAGRGRLKKLSPLDIIATETDDERNRKAGASAETGDD